MGAIMNDTTHTTPATQSILVLPSGHKIRADLLHRVQVRIPELNRDRDYLLKQICERDLWDPLPKGHKIDGGKTIAYLVKTGQLPLEFAICPHAVPKRYRRL